MRARRRAEKGFHFALLSLPIRFSLFPTSNLLRCVANFKSSFFQRQIVFGKAATACPGVRASPGRVACISQDFTTPYGMDKR